MPMVESLPERNVVPNCSMKRSCAFVVRPLVDVSALFNQDLRGLEGIGTCSEEEDVVTGRAMQVCRATMD